MRFILVILLVILFLQILSGAVQKTETGIKFTYEAPNANEVYLVGSFNDWNTTATPMTKNEDGVWQTVLKLDEGKYQYKFIADGNWYFDQDNPAVADDGYGGTNSVVEVGPTGKLIREQADKIDKSEGIRARFNPQVYFKGRFYSYNKFINNENDRYMLVKPENDVNFGIRVKFNPNFEAYTVLNVNNTEENTDMWKTHFNYKRSYLKLKTRFFKINAFDDLGLITFNDPLHIVGDVGKYNYKFGYNYRGLYAKTEDFLEIFSLKQIPVSLKAQVIFADELGDAERDINVQRLTLGYDLNNQQNNELKLKLGGSQYISRNKMSNDVNQEYYSYALDSKIMKNLYRQGWQDKLELVFENEYLYYENINVLKNYGEDIHYISDEYKWMTGSQLYFGTGIKFPQALTFGLNYQQNKMNFYREAAQDSIVYYPSPDLYKVELSKDIFRVSSSFEQEGIKLGVDFEYWKNEFPDSLVNWSDYYLYSEKIGGNGRWFQTYTEVPFSKYTLIGYEEGVFWDTDINYESQIGDFSFNAGLSTKIVQQGLFNKPKFIENIVMLKFDITRKWELYTDTRLPYYNDDVLDIHTDYANDENVYVSNYTGLSYKLRNNIRLTLGWGVKPEVMNEVTDQFYLAGREEFLENSGNLSEFIESSYLGLGEKIKQAEADLMHQEQILLEAVINF